MRPRPMDNPPNPWASQTVEYLGPPPTTPVRIYEDQSRSILASNDSPDLGFRWSLNPYRGCQHACSYCAAGDTEILMASGRTKALADVRVGDELYGTLRAGHYRRLVRTRVHAHWQRVRRAYRVKLEDGTELVTSGDHRFLGKRGWKYVTDTRPVQRAHLTVGGSLMAFGMFAAAPADDEAYRRGYLCGLIRGDGHLKACRNKRAKTHGWSHHFRLALVDLEALRRAESYLRDFEVGTTQFLFAAASPQRREMQAIRTQTSWNFERITELVAWPSAPSASWHKGFLAGIYDAEGSAGRDVIRICNKDLEIIHRVEQSLTRFGFRVVIETDGRGLQHVRILGGVVERMRFFHTVDPAITRKRSIAGLALKTNARLRVVSIERLPLVMPMFDITTGTGDFIANGVVSHNCYARPSHEYLGFGAGTDFDTQIVVKPRAAELLREAFDKPSWQGELILFSGVTDCYQPIEASLELTRKCLQVCAEYQNPIGVITKAPLVERDLDLLAELQAKARVHVTVSVPFWDADKARAIEPWVATPQRRIRAIERLAKAGIPVGVNVAPIIPGLSDGEIPKVLEAAAAAGASYAGIVLLRLPGSVRIVFEERLRQAMPLRADRIMRRVQETRGGKLNDPRFGSRMEGEGKYAQMIHDLFDTTCRRLGLERSAPDGGDDDEDELPTTFRRPHDRKGQLLLF